MAKIDKQQDEKPKDRKKKATKFDKLISAMLTVPPPPKKEKKK